MAKRRQFIPDNEAAEIAEETAIPEWHPHLEHASIA